MHLNQGQYLAHGHCDMWTEGARNQTPGWWSTTLPPVAQETGREHPHCTNIINQSINQFLLIETEAHQSNQNINIF